MPDEVLQRAHSPAPPRPLPLLMAMSTAMWAGAPAAAVCAFARKDTLGQLPCRCDAIAAQIAAQDRAAFLHALTTESEGRMAAYLAGVERYMRSELRPARLPSDVIWQHGDARVLDYGGAGRPVFMVPSLINPAYIFDLMPGRSLIAAMRAAGLRPMLMDWGSPGEAESRLGLEGYIQERLLPAFDAAHNAAGPMTVLGYCMGGTLVAALASLRPAAVTRLAMLAAPWDFHSIAGMEGNCLYHLMQRIPSTGIAYWHDGLVPVEWMQTLFAQLNPAAHPAKFARFAAMEPGSKEAEFFLMLEHWTNDGPPLSARLASDCKSLWYEQNLPARGLWKVGGVAITPDTIRCPLFLAVPRHDKLVTSGSALAFVAARKDAVLIEPGAGHVGMMVGSSAAQGLWRPMLSWLGQG